MSNVINIKKNAFVYLQDEDSNYVYILQKGALYQEETSIITGHVSRKNIKEGSFFGITETVAKCPRTASVIAFEDSVCVELTPAEFEKLVLPKESTLKSIVTSFANNIRSSLNMVSSGVNFQNVAPEKLIYGIASGFLTARNYTAAFEVINRYRNTFPGLENNSEINEIYENSKMRLDGEGSDYISAIEQFIKANRGLVTKTDDGFASTFKNLIQVFDDREVISAEGEKDENLYYLESGIVLTYKFSGQKNVLSGIVMPGEFFGELPVIDGGDREMTCIAYGLVKVFEFSRENFNRLFAGNSQVAYNLIKQMAKKTVFVREYTNILSLGAEREKIAAFFKLLSILDNDSKKIDPKLSIERDMSMITSRTRVLKFSKMLISMTLDISLKNLEDRLGYLREQRKINFLKDDTIIIYDINNLN